MEFKLVRIMLLEIYKILMKGYGINQSFGMRVFSFIK